MISKQVFTDKLREIATTLSGRVSTDDGQWAVKGFIDTYRHIYTISSDTKVISKVLEIHIFPHLLSERGMFTKLGEGWFDDYWMNYDKIVITEEGGGTKRINSLHEFVEYRGGDVSLIVPMDNSK